MKLDDILADLEKKAADESEQKDESQGKPNPFEAKKDDEKKDDKKSDEAKKDEGQEKSAAHKAGADLAKEVMEKVASRQTAQTQSIKGEEMNKQASDAGKALAQALLKQANVGDLPTPNGIMPGVVPNKTQVDMAAMRAEHDQVFQATPGTDGAGNGGTINQIFDAIVADAMGRTGAKDDNQTGGYAAAEGHVREEQTPNQVGVTGPEGILGEAQEKTAAVAALVESGIDFDDAVDLVKAAAAELDFEHDQQVKQAALEELMDQGIDFDSAVEMVKEAGVTGSVVRGFNSAKKAVPGAAANAKRGAGRHFAEHKGRYAAGAGGAAAGAAAGYAVGREKKAALDMLVDNGVDFDTAVNLVEAKSYELYGE